MYVDVNSYPTIVEADNYAYANNLILYFPAGVYVVDTATMKAEWKGDGIDKTIIRRSPSMPKGTVVTVTSSRLAASGLTFDGNKENNTTGCNVLYAGSNVTSLSLKNVKVRGASFNAGWGTGLVVEGLIADGESIISESSFNDNDASGCSIANADNVGIINNNFNGNGTDGLYVNNYDQTFSDKVRSIRIIGNNFKNNGNNGCIVGNYLENNNIPSPTYGHLNIEASQITVVGNIATSNGYYGIGVGGYSIAVCDNIVRANSVSGPSTAGVLFTAFHSILSSNTIEENFNAGIDAGGAKNVLISNNIINNNDGIGINLEGNINVSASKNKLEANGPKAGGIQILVERTGGATALKGFPTASNYVSIVDNEIKLDNTRIGIEFTNNPINSYAKGNIFACDNPATDIYRCILAISGSTRIADNVLLNQGKFMLPVTASGVLEIPEIFDYVVTNSTTTIVSMETSSRLKVGDGVAYCTLLSGGSGYTSQPAVSFSGGGGSGASAITIIASTGEVVGIRMINHGSGYTSAPTVTLSGGGGSGAVASAIWQVPLLQEHRLTLHALKAQKLRRLGTVPIDSPTSADINVPAKGVVNFITSFNKWNLTSKNF